MSSEFKVEKGIPVPAFKDAYKYPFSNMKVGDSFFVPMNDPICRKVSYASFQYGKRHKQKFKIRSVDGGVRCWRIA